MHIVRLALLLLQLASVFGVEEELVVVRGPVALMAAGPQTARPNTTLASLVALDGTMLDFCDLSPDATSYNLTRAKIKGNIVMVGFEIISVSNSCSLERAHTNLVELGAIAILMHANNQGFLAPGYLANSVGGDMLANLEATKSGVPMLAISDNVLDDLKRLLADSAAGNDNNNQQATRLMVESSKNEWFTPNSNVMRPVVADSVASVHFIVVATSLCVLLQQASRGEFIWGSASCWVIFIEMVPALALGIVSLCGMYQGTVLPREVQCSFTTGFPLFALVSTILVARHWNVQAEVAKVGFEHTRAVDPQRSLKSAAFTVAALGFDIANAFFRNWYLANVLLVILLVTIVCAMVFIRATLKMLGAARAADSARRISAYVSASVLCMSIQVAAMIVMATVQPLSPNQALISASILHLTRAGTGLCQLFVFLPCTPASNPGRIHPSSESIDSPSPISIDTRLLAGEGSIVRALQENNGRLKHENARLVEIQQTEEANAQLQQERTARLLLENEVKQAENRRLKNDRAADSSMNHTLKVHTQRMHPIFCIFTTSWVS
jgi:hypothetical protein